MCQACRAPPCCEKPAHFHDPRRYRAVAARMSPRLERRGTSRPPPTRRPRRPSGRRCCRGRKCRFSRNSDSARGLRIAAMLVEKLDLVERGLARFARRRPAASGGGWSLPYSAGKGYRIRLDRSRPGASDIRGRLLRQPGSARASHRAPVGLLGASRGQARSASVRRFPVGPIRHAGRPKALLCGRPRCPSGLRPGLKSPQLG